jgi:hypothetical protein
MGYNPETGMYTPDKPAAPTLSGVGQYQTVDPTFVPNAFAEAQAMADLGLTKAEIAARGGVNASGYYGDSWNANLNLTDAEYRAAIAGKTGVAQGEAIQAATKAKEQKFLAESGTGYQAPNGVWYKDKQDAVASGALLGGAGGSSGAAGGAAGGVSSAAQGAAGGAYALLLSEFNKYGLGSLVEPLKDLIQQGLSPAEFSLALQNTTAYQKRFAANTDRIAKGLTALSPAEYIALEDQYQNIMRNYGLPASYYAKGDLGVQEGFNKLLANDVSPTELEDRVMTGQSRVVNASPEIKQALRAFYPDITDGDILAYSLDPTKALTDIKRKITAAEIGGAAIGQGLSTSRTDAEYLARYGVTKDQAQTGYGTIAEFLPTGQKLSQIYQESPYTQAQAESEVFKLADSAEAAKRRKKLSGLETASFSGTSGVGTLNRDRQVSNYMMGQPGAGSY